MALVATAAGDRDKVLLQDPDVMADSDKAVQAKRFMAPSPREHQHRRLLCQFCRKYSHICDPFRVCSYAY